jgi:hypothetical protein
MKQCPNCGRELPDTATKCGYCDVLMPPGTALPQELLAYGDAPNPHRTRNRWIILICLVASGAPFFIIGLSDAHKSLSAVRNLTPATGRVVGNAMRLDPRGTQSYVPVVEFRTKDGRAVRFTDWSVGTIPPTYKAGDKVSLVYDPSDPETARIKSWMRLWFGAAILMVAGLVPVVCGLVVWATGRI